MDYERLFLLQKKLDAKIMMSLNNKVAFYLEKKILALLVEIGELANETRCFKYWSKKESSCKDIILSEYVDGLHFYISIALDLFTETSIVNLPPFLPPIKGSSKEKQVQAFLQVYYTLEAFRKSLTLEAFIKAWEQYLYLGHVLELTAEEVELAYLQKNQLNHERQRTGY